MYKKIFEKRKKKSNTEKKERDVFAPAPRTKENKAHVSSPKKNKK